MEKSRLTEETLNNPFQYHSQHRSELPFSKFIKLMLIQAGSLTPENIRDKITLVHTWGAVNTPPYFHVIFSCNLIKMLI